MFRKVAQGFTNAATKPGCLGPFQRSLPQQEPASLNTYESNDRNVTGLSDRKNTTKVQQPETFSTQCIGASKFLFGRIPAGGSSGIVKLFPEGNVQFKKLGDIARLDPALCHSESQPVGFGANQQAVKNILAEREKSDILSGTWGLMQNPISHNFREDEMTKENEQGASENQQLETPKSENKELKDENQQLRALKNEELKDQVTQLTEELKGKDAQLAEKEKEVSKSQDIEKQLNEAKEKLKEYENTVNDLAKELKGKDAQLAEKEGEVNKLNDQVAQLTGEKKQFKEEFDGIKAQLASKDEKISELSGQVTKLTAEKNQLDKGLNSAKQSLNEKDKELENKNKELENKAQELEELKSAYESQIKDLQEQLESRNKELEDNKGSKPSAVNAQGVKGKVNYASPSFILSGVCAVGASLATPYLAICAILAVAASVFLALGFHCLYKANTALSNVEVDRTDIQPLLEK